MYDNDRVAINRYFVNTSHAFFHEADGNLYDLFDLSDMTVEEAKQKGITADEMKPLLDSWDLLSGSKQEKDGWLQIGNEGKVNAEHIRELFRQLKTA